MNSNHLIISVESRKGGVGKTTAALIIAKIYLERGYQVLFLDLDLTGTNVTDIVDSPLWESCTNVLNWPEDARNGDKKKADIIDLFVNEYMSNKYSPEFAKINEKPNHSFLIHPDKINIIGSDILDHKNKISPNLLFDEIHAHWFVDFLEEIYNKYNSTYSNSNTVIILDNSPGYIGFVSKIHEWLTDLGPVKGKFMIVSSLDKQDLISCSIHIEELNKIFFKKFEIIKKLSNNNGPASLNKEDINFYLKFIEGKGDKSNFEFYKNLEFTEGQNIKIDPQTYIGLVINKSFYSIVEGIWDYDFSFLKSSLDIYNDGFFKEILATNFRPQLFIDRMVPYDEYIEYQFIISSISMSKTRSETINVEFKIIQQIDIYIKKLSSQSKNKSKYLEEEMPFGAGGIIKIIKELNDYQLKFNQLILQMNNSALEHISRLFKTRWHPMGLSQKLERDLEKLLLRTSFEFHKSKSIQFEELTIDEPSIGEIKRIIMILNEDELFRNFFSPSSGLSRLLINSFIVAFYLAGGLRIIGENSRKLIRLIILPILLIQIRHWRENKPDKRNNLPSFLVHESLNGKDFERLGKDFILFNNKEDFNHLSIFYSSISKAQARVIDMQEDYEFLLIVLRGILRKTNSKELYLPCIRDILDDVIINKSKIHEIGETTLYKEINALNYINQFKQILIKQINGWS